MIKIWTCLILVLGSLTVSCQNISVKVIDFETELPIENAKCLFGMKKGNPFTPSYGQKIKYTNKEGVAFVTLPINVHFEGVSAVADQYYSGGTMPRSGDKKSKFIKLRPIKKPVSSTSFYNDNLKIEDLGKSRGFDLIKGDWVKPYGQGARADILIKAELNFRGHHDYEVSYEIEFPNKYDGIITFPKENKIFGSFTFPYLAPENGYEKKWVKNLVMGSKNRGTQTSSRTEGKKNSYLIRIRSHEESGKFKDAIHGVIEYMHFDVAYGKVYLSILSRVNSEDRTRNIEMTKK